MKVWERKLINSNDINKINLTEILREPGRVANGRLMPFICRNTSIVKPLIAEKPCRAL